MVPVIREQPILGSARALQRDPLAVYTRVARECGDIGSFHLGPLPAVVVNAPDLIRAFLLDRARDYDKGDYLRRAFNPFAERGLFISEGDVHRSQRLLMAPLFQPRRIAAYADTMAEHAEQLAASWSDNETFELTATMTGLTMGIFAKVMLNSEVSAEVDELAAAVQTILAWINATLTSLVPFPLWIPTPVNWRTRRARAVLRDRIGALIAERKADGEERGDLLAQLVLARDEEGRGMDDEQIADELVTAFVAGHDTLAGGLTWSSYLLARHPDCYDQLIREADAVLGDRLPTAADLPRLPYALQVFKEALRLYPPASAFVRVACQNTELGGYAIRRGTVVMISPYVLHRRAEAFPDPERFDPERFAPAQEAQLPRYAYLPFGAGHRTCIGSHFALMEGQILLATLARRVRFELVDDAPATPELVITLHPKGGLAVRARKRPTRAI